MCVISVSSHERFDKNRFVKNKPHVYNIPFQLTHKYILVNRDYFQQLYNIIYLTLAYESSMQQIYTSLKKLLIFA